MLQFVDRSNHFWNVQNCEGVTEQGKKLVNDKSLNSELGNDQCLL
jgi:hypothetical protein